MLTPEIERTIVSFVEAGAWDYVAAEAAGIDGRTFRDWLARGEGRHPSRSPTPELTAFAHAVREAKARSRAAREIEIAAKEPKFWLTHQARSQPGREGWTEPVPDEATAVAATFTPTPEEAAETFRILAESGAVPTGRCADPACTCDLHGGPTDG